MRLTSAYGLHPTPAERPAQADRAQQPGSATAAASTARFSVLNDFRYLTDSDKDLLGRATGERIAPGTTPRSPRSASALRASAFAQQLALDRRTGELPPHQEVTAVYLRNAADAIAKANEGRQGFTNPYSGPVMERAVAYLEATGRARADIRL